MILLIYHKEKRFDSLRHLAVIILHIFGLNLEHELFYTVFAQIADKRIMFGKCLINAEQRQSTLFELAFADLIFRLKQKTLGKFSLSVNKFLYIRLEFVEHLVVSLGNGTGDNERRTGIIDKHRVNLIDNSVVMFVTLHKVFGLSSHVIAKVIETEFIVGSESDVRTIGLAAFRRVGFCLINTIYGKTVELI